MSIWKEIKNQEDVKLSEDGKTIDVCYKQDYSGNHYIEIPIEFVKSALEQVAAQDMIDKLGLDKYFPKCGACDRGVFVDRKCNSCGADRLIQ